MFRRGRLHRYRRISILLCLSDSSSLWGTPQNEAKTSSGGRFDRPQRPTGDVLNDEMVPPRTVPPLEKSPGGRF